MNVLKRLDMGDGSLDSIDIKIAQAIREACIREAQDAFQDASMSGLCSEGAIEAAIGAMQSLNVEEIIAKIREGSRD